MKSTAVKIRISSDAYLEAERKAETKSEYIDGEALAMAGASRRHNQINFNISGELQARLKNRPCVAYASDMRVKVEPTGFYAYPDLVATCDEPVFEDENVDTLLNPSLIVEILSASTEAYDRGEKFAHYRKLSSMAEYVLVDQDKMRVEHFLRQGDQWLLSEFCEPEDRMELTSIGCELVLRDIYDKVPFEKKAIAREADDESV